MKLTKLFEIFILNLLENCVNYFLLAIKKNQLILIHNDY